MLAIFVLLHVFVERAHASAGVRPEQQLSLKCFGWPDVPFTPDNSIKSVWQHSPHFYLEPGNQAIDFALTAIATADGSTCVDVGTTRLSTLLQTGGKPVVILFGMYTCPAFEGLGTEYPFDQCSHEHEARLAQVYGKRVTFLHVVGPEPHPAYPDTNFDSGKVLENKWSDVPQATTYEDRKHLACKVRDILDNDLGEDSSSDITVLVDDLVEGRENPVWCSYASGARTAMLISRDGTVIFAQDWFRMVELENAINAYMNDEPIPESHNPTEADKEHAKASAGGPRGGNARGHHDRGERLGHNQGAGVGTRGGAN